MDSEQGSVGQAMDSGRDQWAFTTEAFDRLVGNRLVVGVPVVAEVLDMSEQAVYDGIREKRIQAIRVNRLIKVSVAYLRQLVMTGIK
jgi:hypothetical protein